MKKILILLIGTIFMMGCTRQGIGNNTEQYTIRAEFIYDLIKASGIEIKYIREPKAEEYFYDVKDGQYYTMALINAVDAGIINPVNKKIDPEGLIRIKEAEELMNRAFEFKLKKNYDISSKVMEELKKNKKYSGIEEDDIMTNKMEEELMTTYKSRLNEALKEQMQNKKVKTPEDGTYVPGGIRVTTLKSDGYLIINLDWGQKSTGGYLLKILTAEEVDNTIVVNFAANAPGPNDIVPQVITYPKDSIRVKVTDINKDYKIVLKGKIKKGYQP